MSKPLRAADDPLLLLHPTAKYFLSDTSGGSCTEWLALPAERFPVEWGICKSPRHLLREGVGTGNVLTD